MRVSAFTLISVAASLATYVAASSKSTYDARELLDEFATRDLEAFDYALERREIIADLSTRDLIDELSDRLERRADKPLKLRILWQAPHRPLLNVRAVLASVHRFVTIMR
ncbi:hypothetical protein DFP72DRAFT_1102452 [Ephemerocybe angulata]|uniref:Uncharacterized protein n=1 Tax=Ephemerocybe angulata TaxID=980116 RepID=A0A8H6I5L3_9AGAR|nr:hypothetical protein DFP72DRAFT_1102452 [Tulosesus angulatus]